MGRQERPKPAPAGAPPWLRAGSPWHQIRRILLMLGARFHLMPSGSPSILRRIRSLPLSIGQLTFGSFLLVLAVITITSIASVLAIRQIGQTFAELERLQSVGDLAEDIDQR